MEIPGHTLDKELGKGGMATVYLATQISLNRQVALKVMNPALAADGDFSDRFLSEARTIAQMNHPGIVAVYDVSVHQHHHYIAMELVAGGDLKQRIEQAPCHRSRLWPLPVRWPKPWPMPMARGMCIGISSRRIFCSGPMVLRSSAILALLAVSTVPRG